MFTTCVKYRFKSTSYCVHSFMLLLVIFALIVPVFIIQQTGGFWIHDWSFMEKPVMNFKYQYLLVVEREANTRPIVCSTFLYYKDNPISDDCTLTKVHEVDTNQDGLKDVLTFEARFFSNRPIRALKLFLLFGCELKDRIQLAFDTTAALDYSFIQNFQKIHISGDLLLLQKSAIQSDGYITSTEKVEADEFPHFQFANSSKMFSAKIVNDFKSWQSGFAEDEEVVVKCKIFYNEQHIHYQLGAWEQYKWAWIQYVSIVIVCIYILKYFVSIMLQKRYFRGHLVVPWKKTN